MPWATSEIGAKRSDRIHNLLPANRDSVEVLFEGMQKACNGGLRA
jgi:hypothetical protein